MSREQIDFQVTRLAATVPEGVPVQWQGRELNSGPLLIELDESGASRGVLDYLRRRAQAEFRVRLRFPDLTSALEELGADTSLTAPVRGTVRSEGAILEDHGFALSGCCELSPHELVRPAEAAASVLPGH
jgi:hypothetical protein